MQRMNSLSLLAAAIAATTALGQPVYAQELDNAAFFASLSEEQQDFANWGLGAGLSVTFDLGGAQRISSAELVGGVVRVTDEDDVRARVMLEGHFFFPQRGDFFGVAPGDWGHGPFIAVQPGGEDIIEAAALGWMIGFRAPGSSHGWSLGVGVGVDPNVQTLGDGLERNMPLPAGETQIRYREEAQYGAVILFTRTF